VVRLEVVMPFDVVLRVVLVEFEVGLEVVMPFDVVLRVVLVEFEVGLEVVMALDLLLLFRLSLLAGLVRHLLPPSEKFLLSSNQTVRTH
jgi:hypothetical protein